VGSPRGVDEHAGGSSTSRRAHAAKQLRGQARGGTGRSGSAPAAEHPPCSSTVASSNQPVLWFCKIRPKVELEPKFHQNKSSSEFCKLQNLFWWPKPILSGTRWIWQNSLKFKSQFGGNSNFWIGADQNFQNYFWFCITTWKISNKKVVQIFQLYNFHVGHFSKFQIDFELGIQIGKGDTFWKSVFSKLLWILY
jgi:hypothetical protein